MKIGVPKEIKTNEHRVGLVPDGVRSLVADGHDVLFEAGAGDAIGTSDSEYTAAGAVIVPDAKSIFDVADMIVKVKEPQPSEVAMLRPEQILFTYLHLASDKKLTASLLETGSTCIAYETVQLADGALPLLKPMSAVAGKFSIQAGAYHLEKTNGGRGVLLGGVEGVNPAKVVVIGCGVAGSSAIEVAIGMGAQVVALDVSEFRLNQLSCEYGGRVKPVLSTDKAISDAVCDADLVVGAVLIPGAKAPKLVTRSMISTMRKGSVVVDIAVDQGGCIETCRPTTHEKPVFIVDGVIHYCVANIPGAVPRTSTYALTHATLPYIREIAEMGVENAVSANSALFSGINVYKGTLVYKRVADDHDLPWTEFVL